MPEDPSKITNRLARLSHAFLARSRGEASRLSELQQALVSSDPGSVAAAVGEIETIAHQLHGTAGTLGFAAISMAAAAVEDAIGVLRGQGASAGRDAARMLAEPIEQLMTAIGTVAA